MTVRGGRSCTDEKLGRKERKEKQKRKDSSSWLSAAVLDLTDVQSVVAAGYQGTHQGAPDVHQLSAGTSVPPGLLAAMLTRLRFAPWRVRRRREGASPAPCPPSSRPPGLRASPPVREVQRGGVLPQRSFQ